MTWNHPALAQRALDAGDREIADLKATIARLRRCIGDAMGCLDPESPNNPDERLAWYRLHDAMQGREPRARL
jgi:hypothetical protein